jgi:hypothetical protein
MDAEIALALTPTTFVSEHIWTTAFKLRLKTISD